MMPCIECGEYTRRVCATCDENVCFDCIGTVHECDGEGW